MTQNLKELSGKLKPGIMRNLSLKAYKKKTAEIYKKSDKADLYKSVS
ncbi:hypothetical protein J502_1562 [Acinetobacter sp. 1294596]|jgi:hypothetical protein|nr:hypothetical protein ACINWCA157_0869 [Acinetobacter radioresistens WC-A-157]EXF57348.1 hypothetical protein J502_1562 [Acinetobacter sp. 1294596]BBL20891.1 hypothetical protein ACRAD_15620 [Acinetobacter radioresistens DSM 6976 = NBRC 102413 = CIP 103788]